MSVEAMVETVPNGTVPAEKVEGVGEAEEGIRTIVTTIVEVATNGIVDGTTMIGVTTVIMAAIEAEMVSAAIAIGAEIGEMMVNRLEEDGTKMTIANAMKTEVLVMKNEVAAMTTEAAMMREEGMKTEGEMTKETDARMTTGKRTEMTEIVSLTEKETPEDGKFEKS